MSASPRPRRRRRPALTVVATGCLLVLTVPVGAAGAAAAAGAEPRPGQFRGGSLVQDGWWAKVNEPPPETGLVQPPAVPAVAAPKGTLPVALVNGEPERVAALEFRLKGGLDTLVTRAVLVMQESGERGATLNAELASIQACPVTEPSWVGVENGAWATRPEYDCDLGAAPGTRDKKGAWTFDLTALAAQWTSSELDASPAVVLVGVAPLDPAEGAPSFQVAFDAADGIGLLARVESLPDEVPADDESEEPSDAPAPDGSSPDGGQLDPGGSGGGGTSGFVAPAAPGSDDLGALPAPGSSDVPGADVPALPGAGTSPVAVEPAGDVALIAPTAAAAQPWYAGLGVRAAALVAVGLALAYLMMVALGSAGQPTAGSGRRGVSRALDRLRAARLAARPVKDPS